MQKSLYQQLKNSDKDIRERKPDAIWPDHNDKGVEKMKTIIKTYRGWAINTRSQEEHGLISRYWWFQEPPPIIPIHLRGHLTAIFETRKKARKNLPSVRGAFPKARVEHVTIDISPTTPKR